MRNKTDRRSYDTQPWRRVATSWLLAHGVSPTKAASMLGTYRGYTSAKATIHQRRLQSGRASRLSRFDAAADDIARVGREILAAPTVTWSLLSRLAIPFGPQEVISATDSQLLALEEIAERIEEVRRGAHAAQDFSSALASLNRLRPFFGTGKSVEAHRQMGRLHELAATCAQHASRPATALVHAEHALQWFLCAYLANREPADLKGVADAALAAGNSCISNGRRDVAEILIEVFAQASRACGNTFGAEYYRQKGLVIAYGAPTNAREASKTFRYAAVAMSRARESDNSAVKAFWAGRHLNWLERNWDGSDGALDLHHRISEHLGPKSLEAAVAGMWGGACGLSMQSDTSRRDAEEFIDGLLADRPRFDATAAKLQLLKMTERITAGGVPRQMWISAVLTMNPYRDK